MGVGSSQSGALRIRVAFALLATVQLLQACAADRSAQGFRVVTRGRGEGGAPAPHDAGLSRDAGVAAQTDSGEPPAKSRYWDGVGRAFATSPSGNIAAVSCHNCYRIDFATPDQNLAATLTKLHAAQQAGADLLELDVKDESGTWSVNHNDDGTTNGAVLDDVLADEELLSGDQLLYLEIKEDQAADPARLLQLLLSIVDAGYAVEGRDVVLRAFHSRLGQIQALRQLLVDNAVPAAAFFRTQVLFTLGEAADRASVEGMIDEAATEGIDGVEFNYTSTGVFELLAYSRDKGLGTNVWTFSADQGTQLCAEFRDASDALTTDSSVDQCRAAVEKR
jgi:glycerophosphoryl diester phosphodiesterase